MVLLQATNLAGEDVTITLSEDGHNAVLNVYAAGGGFDDSPLNVGRRLAHVVLNDKNRAELKKWL